MLSTLIMDEYGLPVLLLMACLYICTFLKNSLKKGLLTGMQQMEGAPPNE
jgi:hypothetical protein